MALLLQPVFLLASVNEPLRLECLSGYRNDQIHWHLERDGSSYTEDYSSIQFWQNLFALRSMHRDIVFYVKGGFGVFGEGTLKQSPSDRQFATQGWTLDGVGHFGYAANLTPDRMYKMMVIPLVGFSGHYEKLTRSKMPKSYQQTWYGPYLGAQIRSEPGNGLIFELGYAYHWLHLRATDYYIVAQEPSHFKYNGWGNHGHSGWAQMDFRLNAQWNLGLFAQIDYFFSSTHPVTIKQGNSDKAELFKIRFTPVSGMLTLSRRL